MKPNRQKHFLFFMMVGIFIAILSMTFVRWWQRTTAPSSEKLTELSPPLSTNTAEKKANKVALRPSTPDELRNLKVKSGPTTQGQKSGEYHRENRILLGDELQRFSDENIPLPMVNRPSSDWKERLGQELLRFQPEDVKVTITHEQSYIDIVKGRGRYVELVVVNYLNPSKENRGYRALIDSENGKIIDTWDRTHVEFSKPFRFTQHQD